MTFQMTDFGGEESQILHFCSTTPIFLSDSGRNYRNWGICKNLDQFVGRREKTEVPQKSSMPTFTL